MQWLNVLETFGVDLLGPTVWLVLWTLVKILVIAVPIILCVAYLTYWERKMIGFMHIRLGPNRVGFKGLLQPFADVFKLLTKEVIVPSQANKILFILAPVVTLMPALAAWAVVPFGPELVLANVNAGLWRDRCRLGFQFKICILSCDARFGANAVLRVGDRICVGDCAVSVGQLEYD